LNRNKAIHGRAPEEEEAAIELRLIKQIDALITQINKLASHVKQTLSFPRYVLIGKSCFQQSLWIQQVSTYLSNIKK